MTRLQWWQRRAADHVAHLQISVVALLVLAAVLYMDGQLLREQFLAQVEAETVALRASGSLPVAADTESIRLPAVDTLPDALRDFQQVASASGIVFVNASYRLEREGALYRYRINTDVESPYPALRAFLNQSMSKHPTLSLDRLEIRRGIDPHAPQTMLEMSFHFGLAADPGAAP